MASGIGKRAHDKAVTAVARIERLEDGFKTLLTNQQGLLEGCNQSLTLVEDRLQALEILGEALTDVIGREKVEDAVRHRMEVEATERMEKERAAIEGAVAGGNLIPGESVNEKSLVVGRHVKKDGTVLHPGWQYFMVNQVRPELRESIMGKKVGDNVEVPIGHFEVQGVYEAVQVALTQTDKEPVATTTAEEALAQELPTLDEQADLPEPSEEDADAALTEYMNADK